LPVRKNVIFVIYEQLPLGMDAAVRCPRGRESGLQSHWHRQYLPIGVTVQPYRETT
jgi:hypothetical protein